MEIFESILKEKNRNLTNTQRRILTYIMDNFTDAIFLNASKIALEVGVSEPSVTRLAQTLGFEGYPAMQRELQKYSHYRLSTVDRLTKTIKDTEDKEDIFIKVMREDIYNLTETLKGISRKTFNKAVSEIWSAHRVYIIGVKEAYAPAMVLANSLKYFMNGIILLQPMSGKVWDDVFDIGSSDLIIGISFPRYSSLTVEILEYAHEHGVQVGAITDSLISPIAQYAEWTLIARCKLEAFIETFTSTMSVINALIMALSIKDTDETMRIMKERERLWKEKRIYYRRGN